MKKILFTGFFFLAFFASRAQQATSVPLDNTIPKPAGLEAMEAKYYCCTKCDYTAAKEQDCPIHRMPLIHVGNYYCPVCGKYSAAEKGNCRDGHGEKRKMEMKYVVPQMPEDDKSGKAK